MPNMLSMDLTNFDPSHVESIFDRQSGSNGVSNNGIGSSNMIDGTSGTMDVEDDVASWLDSLCSEQQNNQQQQVTELGVLQSRNLVSQQIVSQGLNGTPKALEKLLGWI